MTRREFLGLVDRCRLTPTERELKGLPSAEQDVQFVLDETYPILSKSKEWKLHDDSTRAR